MAKKDDAVVVDNYTVTSDEPKAAAPAENKYGGERRWRIPSRRAKDYADERRAKVHRGGPKEGKELTDYEAGIRSGYLQAQSDHAGLYKYKKALSEGKTKEEAAAISRKRGK